MNGNLYQKRELVNTSFFQRLFKQAPQENAVIELNNLLATIPIINISKNDLLEIERRYELSLIREFSLNMEEFYAVYLNYCLADRILNKQELEELSHLKHLLDLDDTAITALHAKLGKIIYKQSFEEAISDGRLSNEEMDFLNKLENTLRLPKELANKISEEVRRNYMEGYIAHIIADQRLSPAEEQELQAIAASLNVNIQMNEQTQEQLKKLKLYWALENLDLPVIQPDIALQRSEICHLSISDVTWNEFRSTGRRTTSSGYAPGKAKEFYLGPGNNFSNTGSQVLKLIDTGTLYLTNKRLIFTGHKKTSTIRIDKILELTAYNDGAEIRKETGKSPVLQIEQKAAIFCIMLERLLHDR